MAELAAENHVAIEGRSLAQMAEEMELAQTLHLLRGDLAVALARVDDTILKSRASAYRTFLSFYRQLNGLAEDVTSVATKLEPVIDFFAQPSAKKSANTDKEAVATPAAPVTDAPKPQPAPEKVPA
ncbi:MAG: hypothetical protein IT381_19030 [Deltaproteobacteria bacterium]|nr:hypothetical protein [Deltaproteobacteria bacterium]